MACILPPGGFCMFKKEVKARYEEDSFCNADFPNLPRMEDFGINVSDYREISELKQRVNAEIKRRSPLWDNLLGFILLMHLYVFMCGLHTVIEFTEIIATQRWGAPLLSHYLIFLATSLTCMFWLEVNTKREGQLQTWKSKSALCKELEARIAGLSEFESSHWHALKLERDKLVTESRHLEGLSVEELGSLHRAAINLVAHIEHVRHLYLTPIAKEYIKTYSRYCAWLELRRIPGMIEHYKKRISSTHEIGTLQCPQAGIAPSNSSPKRRSINKNSHSLQSHLEPEGRSIELSSFDSKDNHAETLQTKTHNAPKHLLGGAGSSTTKERWGESVTGTEAQESPDHPTPPITSDLSIFNPSPSALRQSKSVEPDFRPAVEQPHRPTPNSSDSVIIGRSADQQSTALPAPSSSARKSKSTRRSIWPQQSDFAPVGVEKPPVLPPSSVKPILMDTPMITPTENDEDEISEQGDQLSFDERLSAEQSTLNQAELSPVQGSLSLIEPPSDGLLPFEADPTLPRQTARVINWEVVDQNRRNTGAEGERMVLDFEVNRLLEKFRADLAGQVRHVSAEQGDGLGYDILSFNADGTPRHIEVKSTTDSPDAAFYLSKRELDYMIENQSTYFIYHVFLNRDRPELSTVRIYPAMDVLNFRRTPTQYRVNPRSSEFEQR